MTRSARLAVASVLASIACGSPPRPGASEPARVQVDAGNELLDGAIQAIMAPPAPANVDAGFTCSLAATRWGLALQVSLPPNTNPVGLFVSFCRNDKCVRGRVERTDGFVPDAPALGFFATPDKITGVFWPSGVAEMKDGDVYELRVEQRGRKEPIALLREVVTYEDVSNRCSHDRRPRGVSVE